ncbi:hypothetical protein GN958_ATG11200, partial [Phytophthora infestans]
MECYSFFSFFWMSGELGSVVVDWDVALQGTEEQVTGTLCLEASRLRLKNRKCSLRARGNGCSSLSFVCIE